MPLFSNLTALRGGQYWSPSGSESPQPLSERGQRVLRALPSITAAAQLRQRAPAFDTSTGRQKDADYTGKPAIPQRKMRNHLAPTPAPSPRSFTTRHDFVREMRPALLDRDQIAFLAVVGLVVRVMPAGAGHDLAVERVRSCAARPATVTVLVILSLTTRPVSCRLLVVASLMPSSSTCFEPSPCARARCLAAPCAQLAGVVQLLRRLLHAQAELRSRAAAPQAPAQIVRRFRLSIPMPSRRQPPNMRATNDGAQRQLSRRQAGTPRALPARPRRPSRRAPRPA